MKHKKIISIALALVMLAVMLPMFSIVVFAESSGTYGDNLTWLLDDSGTLTIRGTGNMANYENLDNVPWYSCRSSIKFVVIEKGVTSIGDNAFYSCSNLGSITIPDSVTSIGDRAFGHCRSLESITIPDSITSIGNQVFIACSSLTSIEIPDSVTSIGDEAFYSCKELTSIKLPKGITTISNRMFKNCKGLTSLDIPNGVTSIGSDAFCGCSSLNCINYDGTKKEWKAITIDSTNELTNVEINYLREPETTTTVSGNSFTVTGNYIDGCTVILALYKDDCQGNSQLVDCKTAVYSGKSIQFTTTATDYTSAKVMVWKDLETLEPVCEAYEMKFQ